MQTGKFSRRSVRRIDKRAYYSSRGTAPGERLRSSVGSPEIGPDMRATYQGGDHAARMDQLHARREAQARKIKALYGPDGLRSSFAHGIWIFMGIVFLMIILTGRLEIVNIQIRNRQMEINVRDVKTKCTQLSNDIAAKETGIFVGYEAVDIGLVSDIGVEKQTLVAPEDANFVMPAGME